MSRVLHSVVLLFSTLLFTNMSYGQHAGTFEIPLIEQVQRSSQIVEGRVVSKESFWDATMSNIFTVNTVEVYKVFKGDQMATLEIITPGGVVEMSAERVTPSLDLITDQIGVFMLHESDIDLNRAPTGFPAFKPYSSVQSFYAYNFMDDKAVNTYKVKNGITQTFYPELMQLTNQSYVIMSSFDVDTMIAQQNANSSQPITMISPMITTAGTQSTITITGFLFGATPGTVSFENSDTGGGNFIPALSSQIVSWSDTQVVVEVPSRAGTGRVRVTSAAGPVSTSPQDITVRYAEINVETGGNAFQTRHIDENGMGGATWNMFVDFDSNAAAKASFLRAFETWVCETGINWENGPTTFVDNASRDGTNVIRFDNGSELPSGVLGVCISYFSGCSGVNWFIDELDIVFNDTTNWQFGPANAGGGQFDFESVAVHELGHGHQMAHVIDTGAIMHFAIGPATTSRVLSQNDIDGGNDVQSRSTGGPVCGLPAMTNSACSLSVGNFELVDKVTIYPVPAKDNLFIETTSDIQLTSIQLIDTNGREISKLDINNNSSLQMIDLKNINTGVYFVKIRTSNNEELTKKILID